MTKFEIRPLTQDDRNWIAKFLDQHWGSTKLVSRGNSYYGHLLPGFVALQSRRRSKKDHDVLDPDGYRVLGLLTYRLEDDECEIMTLDSLDKGKGIATELIATIKAAASEASCKRLWMITTNDNLEALRFYQKRGFSIAAVYPGSIAEARKLKPQIPVVGREGIPIRDEIELQLPLKR